MPYSASALGVLPPLWSRAAKNPRPLLTFSSCAVFTLPYCGTRRGGAAGSPAHGEDVVDEGGGVFGAEGETEDGVVVQGSDDVIDHRPPGRQSLALAPRCALCVADVRS